MIKAADEALADSLQAAMKKKTTRDLKKNTPLDDFRDKLEEVLKLKYPCIMTDELMSLYMKDGEDYYSYKQRAKTL